ncbi:hypothetical protein [Aeoliella sp.]|uniref:hypothetical protein n=1 Tax=Aeoliella sp. TaxID=2795800 RepID=UPI003CCBA3BF
MARRKATTNGPAVDPSLLYGIEEFLRAAGIGRTTVARAATLGVELPTHDVGRRVYVDGAEGIQYLKDVAAAQAAEKQLAFA